MEYNHIPLILGGPRVVLLTFPGISPWYNLLMTPRKIYIGVTSYTDPDGKLMPLSITWEDGRTFEVDRVTDVRRAGSDAGGAGIRYTCMFSGRERYLFFEDTGRWFIEVSVPQQSF